MANFSGEVVPDPEGGRSWAIVFRYNGEVSSTYSVPTKEIGEKLILEALQTVEQKAKDEGYL